MDRWLIFNAQPTEKEVEKEEEGDQEQQGRRERRRNKFVRNPLTKSRPVDDAMRTRCGQ